MRMAVVGPCSERYCMKVDVDLTRKRTRTHARTHLQSNSTVSQPREHNVTCREFESWQGCESRGGSGNDYEQLLVLNQPQTRNLKMPTINPPTPSLTTVLLEVIPRHHHMLPHNVFQHARAVGTVRRHVDTGFNCSNVAGSKPGLGFNIFEGGCNFFPPQTRFQNSNQKNWGACLSG